MLTHKKITLLNKLEEVREELHQLSSLYDFDFQKEEIIQKSVELDQLILSITILIKDKRENFE
jgi:hypothetical protein